MRSAIIIGGGIALLAVFLLVARWTGGATAAVMARAALWFLPVWLVLAAANMWMGVAKGYSVAEEAPIFAVIFALPALAALAIWWKFAKG